MIELSKSENKMFKLIIDIYMISNIPMVNFPKTESKN